jgi:hypothetical protein
LCCLFLFCSNHKVRILRRCSSIPHEQPNCNMFTSGVPRYIF